MRLRGRALAHDGRARPGKDTDRPNACRRGKEGDDCVPEFIRKYQQWGAGPRAGQYLILGAKARAFINGYTHVAAEDIRHVAHPVLRHRIIVNFTAEAENITSADLIDRIMNHELCSEF